MLCFPVYASSQILVFDSEGNDHCNTISAEDERILVVCTVKGSFTHHSTPQNSGNVAGLFFSYEVLENDQLVSVSSRFLPATEDIEMQASLFLSDSMFLVSGRFFGELFWDGNFVEAGSGQSAIFVATLNQDLQVESLTIVEGNGFKRITSLAQVGENLFASIYFNGDLSIDDLHLASAETASSSYILKLDCELTMQGGIFLEGTNTVQINSMDGLDSILLVVGTYKGQFALGTDTLVSLTSHSNVFLLGMDASFATLWLRALNGVFDDSAVEIAGYNGNYYVLGNYSGVFKFNDTTTIESTDFFSDVWLASFSLPDQLNWVTTFNGQQQVNATHLKLSGEQIWVAGQYLFEVLASTHKIVIPTNAQMPAFMAKLDPNGTVTTLVSTAGYGIHGVFSIDHVAEKVCITGAYSGTMEYAETSYPVSQIAGFLYCDAIENMYTKADAQGEFSELNVYPQPASEFVRISVPFTGRFEFNIYSIPGQIVASGNGWFNGVPHDLALPGIPSGVYVLQVKSGSKILSKPILIVHTKK